jgi:hypothetical protein
MDWREQRRSSQTEKLWTEKSHNCLLATDRPLDDFPFFNSSVRSSIAGATAGPGKTERNASIAARPGPRSRISKMWQGMNCDILLVRMRASTVPVPGLTTLAN